MCYLIITKITFNDVIFFNLQLDLIYLSQQRSHERNNDQIFRVSCFNTTTFQIQYNNIASRHSKFIRKWISMQQTFNHTSIYHSKQQRANAFIILAIYRYVDFCSLPHKIGSRKAHVWLWSKLNAPFVTRARV